jgi:hypothetical protein
MNAMHNQQGSPLAIVCSYIPDTDMQKTKMHTGLRTAFVAGTCMTLVCHAIWYFVVTGQTADEPLQYLLWGSIIGSSFIATLIAPRQKLVVGTSFFLPATLAEVLINTIIQIQGKAVDFPGIVPGVELLLLSALFNLFLCATGAAMGAATSGSSDRLV